MKTVVLHEIAHGRAGDKGDTSNISVIPYNPEHFPVLQMQVTEQRVLDAFRKFGTTSVKRYELPKLCALNFVLENTLAGGVNGSLALDTHGKSLSFYLLQAISINMVDD